MCQNIEPTKGRDRMKDSGVCIHFVGILNIISIGDYAVDGARALKKIFDLVAIFCMGSGIICTFRLNRLKVELDFY